MQACPSRRYRRALLSLAVAGWAALPFGALAAPAAADIVDKCVKALQTTSYDARIRYQSVFEGGEERQVRIYHVAPDLYRVEPLEDGKGTGVTYYIENAEGLNMVRGGAVVVLPERQYSLNDALTTKFLRDLGRLPGTSVLNGQVGKAEVWALRQDLTAEKPYVITVGVDKRSYFPLYLMVNDGQGRRRVYYEVESLSIMTPDALDDALFTVPASEGQRQMQAPRAAQRGASAAGSGPGSSLPLYPGWLPEGYHIEAIRLLDCPTAFAKADAAEPVIYQIEVFGPRARDIISIFQTQNAAAQSQLKGYKPGQKSSFFLSERDGWMVVVFGTLRVRDLETIVERLTSDEGSIAELIARTNRLDSLIEEAVSSGR